MTDAEYQETIGYLFGLQMVGIKLGLDNIRTLLDTLGNPQQQYPVIHIAGTNGKGSTAAFLASILKESGYRVGLYTSPHLVDFSERIRVNGVPVPEQYVVEFTARIREHIDAHRMTFFEATTAMAFQYFAESGCDIAVIETGLGGRLDATNVVDPALTIITTIGIEHTEFLGDTIESIAAEKGGIVKPGVPLLTAVSQPEALDVLRRICEERGALMEKVDVPEQRPIITDTDEMIVTLSVLGVEQRCALELAGTFQLGNAALAVRAAEMLVQHEEQAGQKGIASGTILAGLRHVRKNSGVAGRFYRISQDPECIIDVAHNPAAVRVLIDTLCAIRSTGKIHLVFGLKDTKDASSIMEMLSQYEWASLRLVQARVHDATPKERLSALAAQYGLKPTMPDTVADGVAEAMKTAYPDGTVVLFGSHYVAGEYLQEYGFPVFET